MKKFLDILLANPVMANLIMVMIIVGGLFCTGTMVRETFPNFSLDMVSVSVAYPGADPEEVEEGICIKIEEALDGIEGIDKLTTQANEGSGSATIELKEGSDLYRVMNDIKNRIDSITTFPVDAEKPVVSEMKFRGDVVAVVVWGDLPEHQLKELGRRMEQEILQLPEVTQTSLSGIRNYEISIELSEAKLRKYGLNFEQVKAAVKNNGVNLSAGQIRTGVEDFRIRALGRKYQARDYRDIPVVSRPDGTTIRLGQLADIRDSFDDDNKKYSLFNGKPSVSINVFKTESEDTIKIANAVKKYVAGKQKELPPGVNVTLFRDRSRMVVDRLHLLIANGIQGLLLVFFSLWLFLDLRLSFWVTMGIPISLAGGLALMSFFGGSINMLSLFGLIMVLGIIVDDAIVIGESIYSKRQQGRGMHEATVEGTNEVAWPVIASVTTTIVAFIPLFFIKGTMGKFIKEIPTPVVAALTVSMLESLLLLPVHLRHLPAAAAVPLQGILGLPARIRQKLGNTMDLLLTRFYAPLIRQALHWRYITVSIAIFILLLMLGLVQGGVVKFVFFPKTDSDFIQAQVDMLPGTAVEETLKVASLVNQSWEKVAEEYRKKTGRKLTQGVYSVVGDSVAYYQSGGSSAGFTVVVELLPSEQRTVDSNTLLARWKQATGELTGVYATKFQAMQGGPGGNPIELELRGPEMDRLLAASEEILNKLRSLDGLFDQQLNWRPGKREFIIKIKPEAAAYGLTLDDVSRFIQGGFYGAEALRIQRGRDDIKVKVKLPEKSGRDSIAYFNRLYIKTAGGIRVPLNAVADISLEQGQSTITRKDRARVVSVVSDVQENKANVTEIYDDLEKNYLPGIMKKYDIGYVKEGQAKETKDSFSSLFVWFPLSLFGIYFIIASIFKSYLQPGIIMTTIPFGLIGGVIGHFVFGMSLTILSMFGMVALAGIVVNDAIVLIECVNARLEAGIPLYTALAESGQRRFRAIFLTTETTFIGLMPIMMERSMQAQFLKPMAISIAFGVLFATTLTLVLIPCLFAVLNDLRRAGFYLCHHRWPGREEVEPRSMFYQTDQLKGHNPNLETKL